MGIWVWHYDIMRGSRKFVRGGGCCLKDKKILTMFFKLSQIVSMYMYQMRVTIVCINDVWCSGKNKLRYIIHVSQTYILKILNLFAIIWWNFANIFFSCKFSSWVSISHSLRYYLYIKAYKSKIKSSEFSLPKAVADSEHLVLTRLSAY